MRARRRKKDARNVLRSTVLVPYATTHAHNPMATYSISSCRHLFVWITRLTVLLAPTLILAAASPQREPQGSVVPISPVLCDDMKVRHVLNPGAPIGCDRLKLINFAYVDFDGRDHDDGEIVVMDAAAKHVLDIFTTLRNMHFPIAKARLMNSYDGNDDASMADNNTSAFNVREIAGGGLISLHAYGLAIDINPKQNPYAKRSGRTLTFNPSADYANRLNNRPGRTPRPGMAEAIVDVFADNGFLTWGGYWDDPIDYQHFQVSRTLATELARLPPAQAEAVFNAVLERYRSCRQSSGDGARTSRSKCLITN